MEDTPPYDNIRETGDRSWSFRLLERLTLPDISDDERWNVAWALEALQDPRCAQPLHDILTNTAYPVNVREVAGATLGWWGEKPADATLRSWWNGEDEILQLHSLFSMGHDQADIIEQVAADPQHRYYRNGIGAMDFGFELPRHQELKIRALSHIDSEVRETAVNVLIWDEPVRAEDALITATYDPDVKVVEAACNALQYYPTQKIIRRLSELRIHENETIRETAERSYQVIRRRFQSQLTAFEKTVRKHIRRWLTPIWDELAFTKKELKREKGKSSWRPQKLKKISARRVLKLVTDPDTSPDVLRHLFYYSNWRTIPAKKREKLTSVFLQHPDSLVRRGSAKVFSAWRDQDSLVKLLSDPEFIVRKDAMYNLGETPPYSNKIAKIAWKHLQRKDAVGTHGYETLATYVHHAKHKKAVPRLIAIAQDNERPETVRHYAIISLSHFEEPEALIELMQLLEAEPPLTWAIHVALLEHARWMGIVPPNLEQLREIDHLDMQVALAPFMARTPPTTP